jgi:hypothetical protein
MPTQPMLAAAAEAAAGADAVAIGRAEDAPHAHDASPQASARRTTVRLHAGAPE